MVELSILRTVTVRNIDSSTKISRC